MTSRGAENWDIGSIPVIAPEVLGEVISTLADVAIVIRKDGKVLSVLKCPADNPQTDLNRLLDCDIRDFLTVESVPKLDQAIINVKKSGKHRGPIELNHANLRDGTEFPVVYTINEIGTNGEILMLGRDLRHVSEMQQQLVNAQIALERDYEVQREFDTRFRVLMAATRDAIVILSVATGRITDANRAAATLLGQSVEELLNAEFAQVFEDQGTSELMADMAAAALSDSANGVNLVVCRSRRDVAATPSFFRAAGSRMMLCRLKPLGEAESQGDDLAAGLAKLYDSGPDAIVFTNRDGVIISANDTFLDLTDSAHGMLVKGRSLSEYLSRGMVDLRVLLDNAARTGQMRVYSTKLNGQYQTQRPVEVSATYIADATRPSFVFVLRDATIGEAARAIRGPDANQDQAKSVVELVGSAKLKDIVADTTEVIERMCIETALDLTSNNRVAAAEMLGLSRQSLYVKLRKYGLLARSDEE